MNTIKTEHGPYEYDRNSDLTGRPYQLDDPTHFTEEDGGLYIVFLEESERREEMEDEVASGALALLILVFVGVVLWKVWVG